MGFVFVYSHKQTALSMHSEEEHSFLMFRGLKMVSKGKFQLTVQ